MYLTFHCRSAYFGDNDSNPDLIYKLEIRREDSKKIYSESQLYYEIKKELNSYISGSTPFIKKLMAKDGHMVADTQYYLRSKYKDKTLNSYIMIYDSKYQIRSLYTEYNNNDSITLDVAIWKGKRL